MEILLNIILEKDNVLLMEVIHIIQKSMEANKTLTQEGMDAFLKEVIKLELWNTIENRKGILTAIFNNKIIK